MTSLDAIFQTSLNQPDEKKRVSVEDAYRLADQEAYGFWNVTGKVAQRAARGFADATINTIDTASRGWSLIHQHLQNEFQGSPWAIGGPIPEEQRQIPRAMGAVEWMTGRSAPDTLDVLDTVGLIDDARRLRDLQSAELQDWEGPAAIAGELASFALPSGPAGIVGRGANNLARNVTHGAVLAKPVGRYLNRLVDAGEMTAEEAAKIAHSGQALVKIAEREGAGGFGRAIAAAGDAAPDLVGEYAALVAQSYAAAPRSEAAEAGKHAAMMGPLFVGIGRSARWLSGRVMDGTLSSSGKEALLKLHDSMNNGARPGLFRTMRALDPADAARVFGIEMLSTGLESTAFTLTNEDAFSALLDAYSGIPGSWGRFGGALAGTYAGVLMGKGLSNGELPYFRRVRPELNSIRTELDRQAAEHQAKLARQTAEQQQRDDTTRRGTEAAKLVGDAMRGIEATADDTLAKIQAVSGDRVVSAFVDPMLRGGMTLEHARVNQPIPEIKLNSPEGYAVTARVLGPKTVMLDVDPQMWKLVMGTEHPGGPVSGSTAADFLNELGLRSSAMKMRGALHFGRMGMLESQAGVSWRNPETGIDYSFGLDGAVYQRPFGETTWRRLPKDDPIEWMIREPIGERPGEQSWWDPAMEAWARFASQKARAFPEAFDEVLATAINTAQYGGNTASAQELRNLFLAMPPEQLISFLRPNNQKAIAHAIAAVGGGLSNHVEAQRLIAEAGRISETLLLERTSDWVPDIHQMPDARPGDEGFAPSRELLVEQATREQAVPGDEGAPPATVYPEPQAANAVPVTVGDEAVGSYAKGKPVAAAERVAADVRRPKLRALLDLLNTAQSAPDGANKTSGKPRRFAVDDAKREAMTELVSEVAVPTRVTIPSSMAYYLREFFLGRSTLWGGGDQEAIARAWLERLRPGEVDVPEVVAKALARLHTSRNARNARSIKPREAAQAEIQSVDAFFRRIVEADPAMRDSLAEIDAAMRFEAEGGATLSELYGGVPLGEIGKALRAFAELTTRGDTTFARSEARMVPDKASQPNRPSRAGSLLDAYMADLPDVVGKYGGAEGERIRGDVVAANELGRDMQGQLQAEGYYSEALPRAEGRKGFRQAKQWLEATVEDGIYRTTRANLILENRMSAEGAPAGVQELLADYRKYRTMTGKWAESVQTVRPNRKTGNFEYFKTNEDAALAIRTNMSEAWMDAYARPFDPRSVEILRAVAAHPENRMDVAAQDAFVKRVQAEAKKVGAGDGPVEMKSATEVLRELRFVPNEVQLNNGDWVVIRDPSVARAMDSMVRREWQGVMSRRAFGQDLPQAARQALNYQRMGPTETLQRMRKASGNDDRAERALRTLMRRFEGASEEGWLPRFKGIAGTIQKFAYDAETLARTAAISGSAKQNIGEALATGTHLAGMPKVLRAMVRAAWSPRQVRRAALEAGALIDSIHGVDIRLHGGVMRAAAKVVGVPHRLSQGYAESVAFLVGESSLKSLSGGSEVARERARMLGFNEGEIASLASSEAPSSLRSRYVREVVKQMTAAKVPTEASSLAYNPKWNAIRAFDRWFMTRTRMTLKIGSRLFRAFQSKDPARIGAALANAATFLVGSTASGALASYLAMVAKQQSFEEAWDQVRQEVGAAGLAKWLAKSGLGASLFGGTGYALYKTLADANATPEQKLVNLTTVGQRGLQLAEFLGGDGIYRDQSFGQKLVTAAPRMAPGLRDAQAVLAIAGLAEEADRFVAAREEKTKWLAEEGRLPRASQEPRDPEFSAAMRKLRDSIRAHATSMTPQEIVATPEFQDAMQGALAVGTGKDISRGLLARRELSGYSIEDLAKMRQRIGDANMGLLYTHDEAMELIAKAFTRKAGTDRAVFPSIDERIEEAERLVQLGGDAEVWRQLRDQVVDEAHEAIKAGGRPNEDIRRLARVLARYPESLDGLVGDRQLRAVRAASAPRAAQLIELFLIDTARRRISNDARDARQPR